MVYLLMSCCFTQIVEILGRCCSSADAKEAYSEVLCRLLLKDPVGFLQENRIDYDISQNFFQHISLMAVPRELAIHAFNIKDISLIDKGKPRLGNTITLEHCDKPTDSMLTAYWLPMVDRGHDSCYTLPKIVNKSTNIIFTPILTGCNVVVAVDKAGNTRMVHQLYDSSGFASRQQSHQDDLNKALTMNGTVEIESATAFLSDSYSTDTFMIGVQSEDGRWSFHFQELPEYDHYKVVAVKQISNLTPIKVIDGNIVLPDPHADAMFLDMSGLPLNPNPFPDIPVVKVEETSVDIEPPENPVGLNKLASK